MWHGWEIRIKHMGFVWGEREEDSLVDEDVDGIIKK
jgi:hypothetical protein